MAAAAVEARKTRAPIRVAGVASVAVHGLVTVPRTAKVLGTSNYATWLLVEDTVIVVSTRDATRLPNGIEMAADAGDGMFESLRHGADADVGFGRINFEDLTVSIARWWDPRPALPALTPEQLGGAVHGLPATVPALEESTLWEAIRSWSPSAFVAAAKALIGRGSGLTPEGDDYLAGTIAAIRILGESLSHTPAIGMLDRSVWPLARLADARTTTFSAALIRYALRGQVAEPAGAFLRAVSGRGAIETSHTRLQQVGHSSGPALAAGIVLAAHALIQDTSDPDRSYT